MICDIVSVATRGGDVKKKKSDSQKKDARPSPSLEQVAVLECLAVQQSQPPFLRLSTWSIFREYLGFREIPKPSGVLLVWFGENGWFTLEVVESGQYGARWT